MDTDRGTRARWIPQLRREGTQATPEDGSGEADAHPGGGRRFLSRRALLVGGVALGAVSVAGVAVDRALRRPSEGRLVSDLVSADPFYVAHRGGSRDWPEMSMTAYRSAVARGVDALEISLARTSDGVWFGLHDETLDRTSGTHGFVAADHTWAEVSALRIQPRGPHAAGQQPEPYLRLTDLVDAYARTHAIFVDPKAAGAEHYEELLSLLDRALPHSTDSFVAKYYCTGKGWARAARRRGYRTWGYYYGSEIDSGQTPLAPTQADWDLLGLDVAASPQAWAAVKALGRPVIAHVVDTAAEARRGLDAGAHGLMLGGVSEVLDT